MYMKLIFKLLVLPLIVAVTLIQWVGIFFTQFSTAIFNLLAGLMFPDNGCRMDVRHQRRSRNAPTAGSCLCGLIIPHIAEWLIIRIAVINYGLRDFIKS